jgi:hypothetical protein
VLLSDQFPPDRTVELPRIVQFCDAVDKNGEGIHDPAAHLTCYKVKPASKVTPQVESSNQFDEEDEEKQPVPQALDVKKGRTQLCVPSEAVAVADPTQPPSGSPTPTATPTLPPPLEHFEIYKAKTTRGTPKFEKREVELWDPFLDPLDPDTNEKKIVTVKVTRPVQLGVPTDKNEEGITNDLTHLTCYSVQAPRFEWRDVFVSNQFDSWYRLRLRKPNMLCVPSYKLVVED